MTDTELRRLAEGAGKEYFGTSLDEWHDYMATRRAFQDHASPDVVLGLLDRCERAERERDELRDLVNCDCDSETRKALDVSTMARTMDLSETIALRERIKALEVERDARPALCPGDAAAIVRVIEHRRGTIGDDPVGVHATEALRAHAAKGGE